MSYYIDQNNETKGPYTIGQLRSMWSSGSINGDTLYCEEGYDAWLHMRVLGSEVKEVESATEQRAILSSRTAATDRPQPIDYGLSYPDIWSRSPYYSPRDALHNNDGLKYRETSWGGDAAAVRDWILFLAIWFLLYGLGKFVLNWEESFFLVFLGYAVIFLIVRGLVGAAASENRKRAISEYEQALKPYLAHKAAERAAARETEQAAHEAELALLRQKRSYWERLNGYEFEMATAEVLKRHQFNPRVTGGSADGGVDIEVVRGRRKGVVQCKAHVACVGPHTVRDLFGVMHHSSSEFGIIVSRGGFTKGAIDFARNKPIFLVDTSDLVAMQEGQNVLAGGFTRTDN
jgi:hypothetical protein